MSMFFEQRWWLCYVPGQPISMPGFLTRYVCSSSSISQENTGAFWRMSTRQSLPAHCGLCAASALRERHRELGEVVAVGLEYRWKAEEGGSRWRAWVSNSVWGNGKGPAEFLSSSRVVLRSFLGPSGVQGTWNGLWYNVKTAISRWVTWLEKICFGSGKLLGGELLLEKKKTHLSVLRNSLCFLRNGVGGSD